MPARLISLNDHPDLVLAGVLMVVGRHADCNARIISSRVSRHHCCLAIERDSAIVRDLNSMNGTWVNGRRVESETLRHGDELRIAHLRYRLEFGPLEGSSSASWVVSNSCAGADSPEDNGADELGTV